MSIIKIDGFYKSLEECQKAVRPEWAVQVERIYDLCEKESDDVYICNVSEVDGKLRFYTIGGSLSFYDKIIDIEKETALAVPSPNVG